MSAILKVGRWAVFGVGAALFAVGVYLGNEGLTAAGGAMAGWATPWVMDSKLATAAHRVIDLVSHDLSSPSAKFVANTDAVKKLSTLSKYPQAKAKEAKKAAKLAKDN